MIPEAADRTDKADVIRVCRDRLWGIDGLAAKTGELRNG